MIRIPEEPPIELKNQNYVCCLCDNEAWVGQLGLVEDISEEYKRFLHSFHAHSYSKLFHWPNKEDTCWVSEGDNFCVIDTLFVASSRRMYCLSKKDDATIARLWGKWLTVVW